MTTRTTVRNRVSHVILAGTLALGLACAGTAGAAEALGSSAAGDTAGLGAALEQVEEGTAGVSASQGTPSFTTATQGAFSLQLSEDWMLLDTEEEDGVTYSLLVGEDGVLQMVTLGEGVPEAQRDEAADEFLDGLAKTEGMDAFKVTGTQDRKLDGMLVRDVAFTVTMDDTPCEGLVTLAFGSSDTALLASVYMDDGTGSAAFAFQQAHRSIAPLAGAGARGAQTTATGSAGTGATAGSTATGDVVTLGDFTYAVDTDPADFVRTTITGTYNDAVEGASVVGVPVTVTNVGSKASTPDYWAVSVYGPDGLEQSNDVNYYLDDSLVNASGMRPGASTTLYVYLTDAGSGEYVIAFDDFSDQAEVAVEL